MRKCLLILLVVFSGALWAQSAELWVNGGASILSNKNIGSPLPDGAPGDVQLDSGFRIGLRFDYNSAGRFGHEIQYAYNRSDLSDRTGTLLPEPGSAAMNINQGGYNLLYYLNATNEGAKVRPFFTVGVHFSDFVTPFAAFQRGDVFKAGINYGGGMKFRISPMFGWRFDIRGYDTGKPNWNGELFKQSGILHQTEASVGLGFYF